MRGNDARILYKIGRGDGASGGSAVVVTDALDQEGIALAALGEDTRARLREFVPPSVSLTNPLDLADASFGGTTFRDALRIAAADPAVGCCWCCSMPGTGR